MTPHLDIFHFWLRLADWHAGETADGEQKWNEDFRKLSFHDFLHFRFAEENAQGSQGWQVGPPADPKLAVTDSIPILQAEVVLLSLLFYISWPGSNRSNSNCLFSTLGHNVLGKTIGASHDSLRHLQTNLPYNRSPSREEKKNPATSFKGQVAFINGACKKMLPKPPTQHQN